TKQTGGFHHIHERYDNINQPLGNTFEWIFDFDDPIPAATKFTKWLSSGDGIYHICGKLGSGKSTFMKMICNYERTRTELEKWARSKGDRTLIMANYFFYAVGSDSRQKSLSGLLRTLIHHILVKRPVLAKDLFPLQWARALLEPEIQSIYDIQDEDINNAYKFLASQGDRSSLGHYCFRFFIDGLDEFWVTRSADRRDLVDYLLDLTNSLPETFKLCVSSREENPFMDMFLESNRLYLHELTKSDMKAYAKERLQSTGTLQERHELISAITNKAEGIFLWVALVVEEIRIRSDEGARFSRLLQLIESLPPDLDQLFLRTLDNINIKDRVLFSYIVLMLRGLGTLPQEASNCLWLDIDDVYFLDDYQDDQHFAKSSQSICWGSRTAHERLTLAKRRLRGICKGLIVAINNERGHSNRLNYTHLSVRDFLEQDDWRQTINGTRISSTWFLSISFIVLTRFRGCL
ncbi:hypothetical protein PG988_003189, partial [Apiospora saccharicola]